MRGLARCGAAAPVGAALLLLAACAQAAPAPTTTPAQGVAPKAPISALTGSAVQSPASSKADAGAGSAQLEQIDNQISGQLTQIDNDMGQVNQGLATSEGDPAQ